MKNALIISSFWPYREGSKRAIGLVNYLPEFGWQPIILTPTLYTRPDTQSMVIETPCPNALGGWGRIFRLNPGEDARTQLQHQIGGVSENSFINYLFTFGGAVINYPDAYKKWKPFAVKASADFLRKETVSAIISIWPVTGHIVARALKAKHNIPWIADFPDLWSQNHNYSYGPLRKALDRRLELKTLMTADVLTTVSEPWADKLRALHKGKLVYSITHGFDPKEVNIPPEKLTEKFTITYTGLVHPKHDPLKLLSALRDLISERTINPGNIEVRFFGTKNTWLEKETERYGLSGVIKQHGIVPQKEAMERQRESQLLLVMGWESSGEKGVHSGKIFEYLGAMRPILATGGATDDVVGSLLNETGAGTHAITEEDIKNTLGQLYREYELKGGLEYKGNSSAINKYSHREMAKKFSEILSSIPSA